MAFVQDAWRVRCHIFEREMKFPCPLSPNPYALTPLCRQAEVPWCGRPFNAPRTFSALITLPHAAGGWILWPRSAQETASRILIPRLHRAGLGTVQLLDDCSDLPLEARAERILAATAWLRRQPENENPLPMSYLGLGVQAPAVLWAAAEERAGIAAVVAGCGRYDELEAKRLTWLWAPTRLLVNRRDNELLWQAGEMAKLLTPPHDVVRLWGSQTERGMARGAAGWYLRWMVAEESRRKRAGAVLSRKLRVQKAVRAAKVGLATGALVLGYLPLVPRAVQPASSSATVHPDPRNPAFGASSTNPFGMTDIGSHASPVFADIDGDGDLDGFVGRAAGNTVFFSNTGTAVSAAFAASSLNPFGLTNIGGDGSARNSSAFADIDGDGDLDAFIGSFYGNTVFFRNTGTATSPAFAASSVNPFGLADVGLRYAAPTFEDIDGDGDLDALIADRNTGIHFFRNTGTATSPDFAASSLNPFGLTNVGSYFRPAFTDLDGDGDLDAFVGNFEGNTIFFRNTGTAVSPAFGNSSSNPFGLADIGLYAHPAFADLDGDGDLDAFIGEANGNTIYFPNTGTSNAPNFTSSTGNPFGLADIGTYAAPSFADLDGDGDLDALVGNGAGSTIFFRNTGTARLPAFGSSSVNPFGLTGVGTYASPAFADIDGDGDLDALVGNFAGNTVFFRNTGTATGPLFASSSNNPFGLADIAYFANPAFADIDGDGDLDALVGNNLGNTVFFRNTGTATGPLFASSSNNPFGLAGIGGFAAPAFADLDGDGDLDALVGNVVGNTVFFRNTGTAAGPAFASSSNNPFGLPSIGSYANPTFADLNGDGDMDASIGQSDGNTFYFRNTANPNTVVLLAWLRAVGGVDGVEVSWKTATESQVLGFHVYRAESVQSAQGAVQRLTGKLIVARTPGGVGGADYVYRDTTAVPGRRYAYWLEVTTLSGGTERYGTAIGSRE